MGIFGKVFKVLPKEEGLSKAENYFSKQTVIITNDSEKKIAVDFFGDKKVAQLKNIKEGDIVQVHFNIESRPIEKDFAERWFTSINGVFIRKFVEDGNVENDE